MAPLAPIYRLRHGHVSSNMSGFVELLELRRDFDDALNELKIEMELEVTIRHRYIQATDTSIRIEGGILGTLVPVDFYQTHIPHEKHRMSFVDALHAVHTCCREIFELDVRDASLAKDFAGRLWMIFRFIAGFARFRFVPQAKGQFQMLIHHFMQPGCGACAFASSLIVEQGDGRDGGFLLQRIADCLGTLHGMMATSDRLVLSRWHGSLVELAARLSTPLSASKGEASRGLALLLFPISPRIYLVRSTAYPGSRIVFDARASLVDPLWTGEVEQVEPLLKKSGKSVLTCVLSKYQHLLQHHSIQEPRVVVRDVRHARFWVRSQAAARDPCRSLDEPVTKCRPPHGILLAVREDFSVGEEVLAFYDAAQHPEGYHLVSSLLPGGTFPLIGFSCCWLPATVVGGIVPDETLVQGFARVRVRFEGHFLDSFGMAWLCRHRSDVVGAFGVQWLLGQAGKEFSCVYSCFFLQFV